MTLLNLIKRNLSGKNTLNTLIPLSLTVYVRVLCLDWIISMNKSTLKKWSNLNCLKSSYNFKVKEALFMNQRSLKVKAVSDQFVIPSKAGLMKFSVFLITSQELMLLLLVLAAEDQLVIISAKSRLTF